MISVLALDLFTKNLIRNYFHYCDPIGKLAWEYVDQCEPFSLIRGFFDLILTYNTGAAFSIFAGDGGPHHGLKMAALAAVSLLPFLYFYYKAKASDRLVLSSLGLIWGGALGNIHDRLRWNAVADFLDFYVGDRHWPAFNVADMAICVGAGLLALSILRDKPAKDDRASEKLNHGSAE